MLLAEGHVVYYGSSAAVVPWFATLGFAMPYGVNVADFLLDLAQGEVEGGSSTRLLDSSAAAAPAVVTAAAVGQKDVDADGGSPKKQQGAGGVAAVAAAQPGDLMLSGPAAIQALYSSYKHFAAKHREGFAGEHELQVGGCGPAGLGAWVIRWGVGQEALPLVHGCAVQRVLLRIGAIACNARGCRAVHAKRTRV